MKAIAGKIRRDLLLERGRAFLVVLAIALGVAAFTTVLASYAVVGRELDRGYLATSPASATLATDDVDADLLAAAAALPGVQRAEARGLLHGRLRGASGGWRNLRLYVIPDFTALGVGRIENQEGAWPPAKGEILIERDAFQVFGGRIGDRVWVKTAGGRETGLRITGSARDVGQAQARMERQVYGYVTPETLSLLGETPRYGRLLLLADRPGDEARIAELAAAAQKLLESRGHPVYQVETPRPGRHPHADLMATLLRMMAVFGALVLALAGLVAFTLLTAALAAQVRQIGLMKALGAGPFQIAAIYLAQAGLLGVAAVLLGLPAGLAGCRRLTLYLARFLNFDMTSFAVPAWVYLLVALAGIATPLLAAVWPVFRATAVPALVALGDHGAGASSFRGGYLDPRLASWSGFARPLVFGLRNAFRRRKRLLLTVFTLALAGTFFLCGLNLRLSLIRTIDRIFAAKHFDLVLTLAGEVPPEAVETALNGLPGFAGGEVAPPDKAGVAPTTRAFLRGGDPVAVEDRLEAAGLRTLFLTTKAESRYGYDQHMVMIYAFLLIVAGLLAGVGFLGLATALSLAVRERRREIGILRAIGASPAAILRIFAAEGATIGLLAFGIAALAAWPLSRAAGDFLARAIFRGELEFGADPRGLAGLLAASLLLGALAGLLPAWRALRTPLAASLAYE